MIGEDFILPNQEIVLDEVSKFNTFLEKKFNSSPSRRAIPNPPSFIDDEHDLGALDDEFVPSNRSTTSSSSSSSSSPLINESIEVFLNSLSGDIYKDLLEEKEKSIDELKSQNQFSMLHSYSRIRIALRVTNTQIMKMQEKIEHLKRKMSKARKKTVMLSRRMLFRVNEIQTRKCVKECQISEDEERVVSPLNLYSKRRRKRHHRRVSLQPTLFTDEFMESPKKRKRIHNKLEFEGRRRRKTTNQLFQKGQGQPRISTSRSMNCKPINWREELRKLQGEEAHQQSLKNEEDRKRIRVLKTEIESIRRRERYLDEKNEVIRNEYDYEKRELGSKLENLRRDLDNYDMKILDLEKVRAQNSFLSLEKEVYKHIV